MVSNLIFNKKIRNNLFKQFFKEIKEFIDFIF